MIILKCNPSRLGGCRLDLSGWQHLVMSLNEYDIELLGSIKALNLLSGSVTIRFSRRTLFLKIGWLISQIIDWLLYWFTSRLHLLKRFKINTDKLAFRFPVSKLQELFKWRLFFLLLALKFRIINLNAYPMVATSRSMRMPFILD